MEITKTFKCTKMMIFVSDHPNTIKALRHYVLRSCEIIFIRIYLYLSFWWMGCYFIKGFPPTIAFAASQNSPELATDILNGVFSSLAITPLHYTISQPTNVSNIKKAAKVKHASWELLLVEFYRKSHDVWFFPCIETYSWLPDDTVMVAPICLFFGFRYLQRIYSLVRRQTLNNCNNRGRYSRNHISAPYSKNHYRHKNLIISKW